MDLSQLVSSSGSARYVFRSCDANRVELTVFDGTDS